MWIAIAGALLAAAIVALLVRESARAKRRTKWAAERLAFDEREAQARLRIVSGTVDVSQRRPPIAGNNGCPMGKGDAR